MAVLNTTSPVTAPGAPKLSPWLSLPSSNSSLTGSSAGAGARASGLTDERSPALMSNNCRAPLAHRSGSNGNSLTNFDSCLSRKFFGPMAARGDNGILRSSQQTRRQIRGSLGGASYTPAPVACQPISASRPKFIQVLGQSHLVVATPRTTPHQSPPIHSDCPRRRASEYPRWHRSCHGSAAADRGPRHP